MEEKGIDYSSLVEESLMRQFWERHWSSDQTGWDIGYPSPPITEFMKSYPRKDAAILIPGCGNAYEAEFLSENGFTDITLLDISPTAVERVKGKFKDASEIEVVCADFFNYRPKREFDLLLEQTFFCAIDPAKRRNYAAHAAELLKDGGMIAGVLFKVEFEKEGPPYGGNKEEYEAVFQPHFNILRMEEARNSIAPRLGNELFITLEKK